VELIPWDVALLVASTALLAVLIVVFIGSFR
jgi:hypothetical protein